MLRDRQTDEECKYKTENEMPVQELYICGSIPGNLDAAIRGNGSFMVEMVICMRQCIF